MLWSLQVGLYYSGFPLTLYSWKSSGPLLSKIEGPREKSGSPEVLLFLPYCFSTRTPLSLNHSPVFSMTLKPKMVSNAFLISSHSHNYMTVYDHRESLTTKLFEEICCDTNHKLHHLLPEFNRSSVDLRKTHTFNVPRCKTNRLKNSFIYYNSSKMIS